MERTSKVVLFGITSFVLVLTLNFFRKRRNQPTCEEKQSKRSEPVKSVTFDPSVEIIEETTIVEKLGEQIVCETKEEGCELELDTRATTEEGCEVATGVETEDKVVASAVSVTESSAAVQATSDSPQSSNTLDDILCVPSDLEDQILTDEAIIEVKSNELKALVGHLAQKSESKMSASEVVSSENLNNNNASEELSKLVEDLKLREKAVTSMDLNKATSERDSANNSPADFSTTNGSIHSDAHSESSADGNDSGKGGSDIHVSNGDASDLIPVSPPSTPLITAERIVVYEFLLPQKLCGVLIGRYGSNVNDIKTRTGASLLIKKHPTQRKFKICAIEGTKTEIDHALEIIRDKFPENQNTVS